MKNYFIYILTNRLGNVMYTILTNNLECRIAKHKSGLIPGFTQKYKTGVL